MSKLKTKHDTVIDYLVQYEKVVYVKDDVYLRPNLPFQRQYYFIGRNCSIRVGSCKTKSINVAPIIVKHMREHGIDFELHNNMIKD